MRILHFTRPQGFSLFLLLAFLLPAGVSAGDRHLSLDLAPGDLLREGDVTVGEDLKLPAALAATLRASQEEERIVLEGFPVAPGHRVDLVLERFEVYAASARILVFESDRDPYEIPRSRHLHFLGASPDGRVRVGLSLNPETGSLQGIAVGSFGTVELASPSATDPRRLELRDAAWAGKLLDSACGSDRLPTPAEVTARASAPPFSFPSLGATTYQAVIAVDTDNEFHHLRFGNDTTAAADYLADLFTAMNVYYNRDVDLNLLLGETIFRLDTDPSPTYDDDPWVLLNTPADGAILGEFGSYWASNMSGVERVFAMLLSGKSSSDFSTSGIAWEDGYCENQSSGGGYSVTQTFRFTPSVVPSGARVIAHEIGHNLGSPHTHCYSPPVDECFHLQPGCFSGTPSCPQPQGNGTVMSYCHFSNGANCGDSRDEFHPTVAALFNSFILAHFPSCIVTPGGAGIFEDGFELGNTSAWSSTVP